MSALTSRPARVAAVVLLQLALVGVAVSGQLSARLTGDEYTFRVEPIDPIDPFRGAYVTLDYPDLVAGEMTDGERGDVFLPLIADGKFWKAGTPTRDRPDDGPYLACTDRPFDIQCGIDSWFLPQDEAGALEDAIREGQVIARVKIDSRGNAALISVETR